MTKSVATYFTSSDSAFYPGTVALINSLHLTGNDGDMVVFDLGLTERQRRLLSSVAMVKPPSNPRDHAPKALPARTDVRGTVVVIDSDMLVVGPLDDVIQDAERGKLVSTSVKPRSRLNRSLTALATNRSA